MIRVLHYNVIPMNGVMNIGPTKEKLTEQHLLGPSVVALWHIRGVAKYSPRPCCCPERFTGSNPLLQMLWMFCSGVPGMPEYSVAGWYSGSSKLTGMLEESASRIGWLVLSQVHHPVWQRTASRACLQDPALSTCFGPYKGRRTWSIPAEDNSSLIYILPSTTSPLQSTTLHMLVLHPVCSARMW